MILAAEVTHAAESAGSELDTIFVVNAHLKTVVTGKKDKGN